MSKIFRSDAARACASVAGALLLSATFIVAAVGPAKAAAPVAAMVVHGPAAY